jgi:hypothetical protein
MIASAELLLFESVPTIETLPTTKKKTTATTI